MPRNNSKERKDRRRQVVALNQAQLVEVFKCCDDKTILTFAEHQKRAHGTVGAEATS